MMLSLDWQLSEWGDMIEENVERVHGPLTSEDVSTAPTDSPGSQEQEGSQQGEERGRGNWEVGR